MKTIAVIIFGVLVFQQCSPRSLPEESVVSVYNTPQPGPDVYHQIVNNIGERITSPIYRFFGITKNDTEITTTTTTTARTTKSWDKIENLDEGEEKSKTVDNHIGNSRDVEELSPEALKKKEKPEKITLYSSYLPTNDTKLERNDTINEISDDDDDDFSLDFDDEKENRRQTSTFVYILELIGSFIQLIYGGIVGYFSANNS